MQLQNCAFSKLQSSKSNLRSSFANLFNIIFSKTCWKSPKLYQRILAHFEKKNDFFVWKKVFCIVKWAKTNACSSTSMIKANKIAKSFPNFESDNSICQEPGSKLLDTFLKSYGSKECCVPPQMYYLLGQICQVAPEGYRFSFF